MISYNTYLRFLRWVYPEKPDSELVEKAREYMKQQHDFYRREK